MEHRSLTPAAICGSFYSLATIKIMENILKIAETNRKRAEEIIRETRIAALWEAAGCTINQVGSLAMGLMMKHRDIDFHIYSDLICLQNDFAVMEKLAEHPNIRHITFTDLRDTEEACVEWHALFHDRKEVWQIDMIHILKGSKYDGYFERVAERINRRITPKEREIVLRLKYETPENEKIMGIEYYRAVIEGGASDWESFMRYREAHPANGVVEWMP